MKKENLAKLARLIRYWSLTSTTAAGSGHPTSSLSAADLMTMLFFGGYFRFDIANPQNPNNDRLIFSKGHASPLFYALWAAAGAFPAEELMTLRKFGSRLEGHPTMEFPFTEAATGSLGQGLSVGFGMALNSKYLDKLENKIFVLLGDSEMAEGSVWEAAALAAHYKLDNLVGIIDVNSLGQRGLTMYEHHMEVYERRLKAFGWETIVIDGHNFDEISKAFQIATSLQLSPRQERGSALPSSPGEGRVGRGRPFMIIAKTEKGKGVSFIESKDGWHGKPLSAEELEKAKKELGEVDGKLRGELAKPESNAPQPPLKVRGGEGELSYSKGEKIATRKAYGNALARIGEAYPNLVVLDAEVSNSTFAEKFKEKFPARFFEMYIAEQNMVGAALGLSRRGKIPFVSTFAAFFTRAFDQIRMSQYSDANIKFCGSHAGVSIGEDGASQMGLEDIAMFRTLLNSVVLYPSDAVATERLVEEAAKHHGNVYIRTTRKDTPVLYNSDEKFRIGGCKVLRQSTSDRMSVVAAGITLHEALAAYEELQKEGINIRVIDLYSIKPLDIATLKKAAAETGNIITVEDHFPEGGIGEAVSAALSSFPPQSMGRDQGRGLNRGDDLSSSSSPSPGEEGKTKFLSLAVRKMPRSGKPDELLDYEGISKNAIVKAVKQAISGKQ